MRPSNGFETNAINPLAPFAAPIHWIAGTSVHIVAGLAAGALLTVALRALKLRWTWAAAGLGATVLAAPMLGGATVTLLSATCFATVRSRRRHNHEVAAGRDLAEAADQRRGPLDLLRMLMKDLTVNRDRQGAAELKGGELTIAVGVDAYDRIVRMPLGGSAGGTHTLVVGAAGSGKTVTQTWIAVKAIERGMPVVVVDPKDDEKLRTALEAAASRVGKQLLQWSPDGPTVFNPFANGSETEIADKLLAGERFTEPHYMRQAQRFLGHEIRALRAARMELSLSVLAAHLDADALERLLRGLSDEQAERGYRYLESLTQRQRSDLSGVRDRLAIVAESDVGEWIDPTRSGARQFDLRSSIEGGAVVLLTLRSDQRPLLMRMLGAAIIADLSTTMAALQSKPIASLAVIDEFAALASTQIGGLFGRARGAGMSLVLGTQELSDLELPSCEGLGKQVAGNLTTMIAHRQVVPESAERISMLAGSKGAWRRSLSSDGRYTDVRVMERVLPPEKVSSLPRGCAAVIVHTGSCAGVRLAAIHSASQRS